MGGLLRGGGGRGADRRLANGKVHEARGGGKRHVGVPHPLVIAEGVEGEAAEIRAEESAHLVRQQRDPEERGEVAHAEELADDRGRRWDGREPREAEACRE